MLVAAACCVRVLRSSGSCGGFRHHVEKGGQRRSPPSDGLSARAFSLGEPCPVRSSRCAIVVFRAVLFWTTRITGTPRGIRSHPVNRVCKSVHPGVSRRAHHGCSLSAEVCP